MAKICKFCEKEIKGATNPKAQYHKECKKKYDAAHKKITPPKRNSLDQTLAELKAVNEQRHQSGLPALTYGQYVSEQNTWQINICNT